MNRIPLAALALWSLVYSCGSSGGAETQKRLQEFVSQWQQAHNEHDLQALQGRYAPVVFYFGEVREEGKVLDGKAKYFFADSDYKESMQGALTVTEEEPGIYTCTFLRRVFYKKKEIEAPFCLTVKMIGNEPKIIEEIDAITCRNVKKDKFPAKVYAAKYVCDLPAAAAAPMSEVRIDGNDIYVKEGNVEKIVSSGNDLRDQPAPLIGSRYIAWWEEYNKGDRYDEHALYVYDMALKKREMLFRNYHYPNKLHFSPNEEYLYVCMEEVGEPGSGTDYYCLVVDMEDYEQETVAYVHSVLPNGQDPNTVLVRYRYLQPSLNNGGIPKHLGGPCFVEKEYYEFAEVKYQAEEECVQDLALRTKKSCKTIQKADCQGSGGKSASAPAVGYPDKDTRARVYGFASQRRLTESELWNYSASELRLMRNEIFAAYGYIFKSEDLRNYFSRQAWYTPRYTNVDKQLTPIEQHNVALIKRYE